MIDQTCRLKPHLYVITECIENENVLMLHYTAQ